MNEGEIRSLFKEWVDAVNSNDEMRIRALYADDAILYQAHVKKQLVGADHIIARLLGLSEFSSDATLTIRELHVAGDAAILEFTLVGTNDGPFLDYDATGRTFDVDSVLVFTLRDGKITKHTTYFDAATILHALGYITIKGARPEAA